MRSLLRLLAGAVLIFATGSGPGAGHAVSPVQSGSLVVAAASSLGDVVTEIADAFAATGRPRPRLNIGGSSFLARQIVQGAPVDVFISADETQMDVAERSGRLVPGTRRDLLSNTLVVIASTRTAAAVDSPQALASPVVRRLAMANPESVPAGVYGRRWLEGLGLWPAVAPKVVPLLTVRSALAAVRADRADAGIVYATDARTSPGVRVVHRVPAAEGPEIRYPAAAVAGDHVTDARRLLEFLDGPEARRIFERAGFIVLGGAR